MDLIRKRRDSLRREVRELREEVARLRAELAAARAPVPPTLQIAPGTTRMIPLPNAGACAGWPGVTIYEVTGAAQSFSVQINSAANCAAGPGLLSVLP